MLLVHEGQARSVQRAGVCVGGAVVSSGYSM